MAEDPVTYQVSTLVRFSQFASAALSEAREEIDALNVFPVPDGDTGTNLFLTLESANQALAVTVEVQGGEDAADLVKTTADYSRGLLLGARGNSGVIMSQLIGALVKRLAAAEPGERVAVTIAEGMAEATAASYAAVGTPVEGTILTVARMASEAARLVAADPESRSVHVIRAAAKAAREALLLTPEQLPVLKSAGVVDAGGRGLCVVLDAAETALTGKRPEYRGPSLGRRAIPVPLPSDDLTADGPAYEVMYLLDAPDDAIPVLRTTLQPLGDSLVVVGGDCLWNVHVHVDDVGSAIEAGIRAGTPYRIRVTHFAEQLDKARAKLVRRGRRVVVVAFGDGLAALFAEAGATVITASPDRRPSTGELLEAIRSTGAAEVLVLPNDKDVLPAAEAAARTAEEDGDVRVTVIPTHAQVQGLAALAVHEPGRTYEQDLVEMTAAARHARSGAVTVAARQAMTMAGPCEPGDVLGIVEGDFKVVGADLLAVSLDVLEKLLGGGGEMVTIVTGAEGGHLADRCAEHLASEHPTVDVVVYDGGQERYPLLIGVE